MSINFARSRASNLAEANRAITALQAKVEELEREKAKLTADRDAMDEDRVANYELVEELKAEIKEWRGCV